MPDQVTFSRFHYTEDKSTREREGRFEVYVFLEISYYKSKDLPKHTLGKITRYKNTGESTTTWTLYPKYGNNDEVAQSGHDITFTQVSEYNVSNGSRSINKYTTPGVDQLLMRVDNYDGTRQSTWRLEPLESTGGAKHIKKNVAAIKIKIKAKWVRTASKVAVKGGSLKTVYRNSNTGEQRVRKMVARPDGTKRATYVKF